jgi:starch synthase
MKIGFISPGNLSEESGGKTHTLEFAKNWTEMGHEVYLFSRGKLNDDCDNNFHYKRIPFIPLKFNIDEITFSISLFIILILNNPKNFDIIFQRSGIFNINLLYKKFFLPQTILELNDLPFSEIIKKELSKEIVFYKKIIWKFMLPISRSVERASFKNCDKIIITTDRIKNIDQYDYFKDKVHFLTFGANTTFFKPLNKNICRKQLDLPENKIIIKSKYPELKFLIVGDEPKYQNSGLKEKLVQKVNELELQDSIIFTGRVPYESVELYINASDLCIVAQKPNRKGYTPLKLFEYMACSKPIVGSNIEGVREIIKKSNCGLVVDTQKPNDLANAVLKILTNEELSEKFGENGFKSVIEKYNWKTSATEAINISKTFK